MRLLLIIFSLSTWLSGYAQEKHLFILSGQSNMYKMDHKISFLPAVAEAFGQENVIVVRNAKRGAPIRGWYKDYKFPESMAAEEQATKDKIEEKKKEGENSEYGFLYDRLMTSVNKAIEGKSFDTVTFIWMQGESDSGKDFPSVYANSFNSIVKQLKVDLKVDSINIVVGRLSDFGKEAGWAKMRDILVQVAADAPHGAWVDTDDLNDKEVNGETKNDLHYTKEGYEILGKRFAEKAIELIKNKKTAANK